MEKSRWLKTMWSDPWLMLASLALTMLGVAMVYSTTHVMGMESRHGDALLYVKKHGVSLFLGMIGLIVLTQTSVDTLRRWSPWILLVVIALLGVVLLPGVGLKAGGAQRWLKIGSFRVGQPAEIAKIGLILFLAYSLERKADRISSFFVGFAPNFVVAMILIGMLMVQPDFGTSMLLLTITVIMVFVAGTPIRFLLACGLLGAPVIYLMLVRSAYRWKRITAFLDPFAPENVRDGAYQLVQSLKTFALGGLWGVGIGQSKQKLGYLPEAHTDFIFAIVGEELGLLGVLLIMAAFLFLVYRGFRIALRTNDLFSKYLALGISCMIGLQCLLNIGVVIGALPTKGMPLPFISFARSSLIVVLCCIGILQRIEADTLALLHQSRRRSHEQRLRASREQEAASIEKTPVSSPSLASSPSSPSLALHPAKASS